MCFINKDIEDCNIFNVPYIRYKDFFCPYVLYTAGTGYPDFLQHQKTIII